MVVKRERNFLIRMPIGGINLTGGCNLIELLRYNVYVHMVVGI